MSEISHIPRMEFWVPASASKPARRVAGKWDLIWEDGVCVEMIRRRGLWWGHYPLHWESGIAYEPASEFPKPSTRTRRELVQVLTEWRRRDLRAMQRTEEVWA